MNATVLLWGVLFGSIGTGYFMYGRKRENMVIRYTGVALMVYPYFITNTIALVLVGIALMFLPKFVRV